MTIDALAALDAAYFQRLADRSVQAVKWQIAERTEAHGRVDILTAHLARLEAQR